MMKTSDNADEPDFSAAALLAQGPQYAEICRRRKADMEKEPHNAKYWFMTHLLTVLLDRLMWAISQATVGDQPVFPSTRHAKTTRSSTKCNTSRGARGWARPWTRRHCSGSSAATKTGWRPRSTSLPPGKSTKRRVRIPSGSNRRHRRKHTSPSISEARPRYRRKGILMPILNNIQEAALAPR